MALLGSGIIFPPGLYIRGGMADVSRVSDAFKPPSPTHVMPPRIALLACSVFEREIALFAKDAQHIVETRYYEIALHDRPDVLRAKLQEELASLDAHDDIDAVVFAYGLCGRGTVGLRAGRHPFVIPRAHDCITVFMGSKEAYAGHQRRCPTCYYYTPGWNQARRVPGPDKITAMREEYAGKFDEDAIEFLIESEEEVWAMHDTATYIDLGTDDAEAEADYAKRCAETLGWTYERIHGDPALLRDLLWGNWDEERFQTITPGSMLGHATNESVMRAEPAPATQANKVIS